MMPQFTLIPRYIPRYHRINMTITDTIFTNTSNIMMSSGCTLRLIVKDSSFRNTGSLNLGRLVDSRITNTEFHGTRGIYSVYVRFLIIQLCSFKKTDLLKFVGEQGQLAPTFTFAFEHRGTPDWGFIGIYDNAFLNLRARLLVKIEISRCTFENITIDKTKFQNLQLSETTPLKISSSDTVRVMDTAFRNNKDT